MDVNGVVIATSEVIRLEKGFGMLLTVCNPCTNLYFYILVKDILIKLWKKIYVSQFYRFFQLKIGAVELLSGTKIYTLLTTFASEFQEILEHDLKEIKISSNVLKMISIPEIMLNPEKCSLPKLISYQGVITKVKNSNLGIYEVDRKVHLYCIHNSFRTILPLLEEGFKVFISNAHLFIDFMDRKILVCCGLSAMRLLDSQEENVVNPKDINLYNYSVSAFDIIWLEMLLTKLSKKFHWSIISSDYSFDWKNETIINEILECFTNSSRESLSSSDRTSIGDEFCSNPHLCDVFCADVLPTGCKIFQISEILDKVSSKISWTENSKSWKTCFVKNEAKHILIGMLHLSKDGCWHIMDESCDIPIMFTQQCSRCTFSKNTLCLFNDLNLGYLAVLQNFDIVHEKIKFSSNSYSCFRYLKTACCYLFYLGHFMKGKDNLFHSFSTKVPSFLKSTQCSVDEVTNILENTHLDKQDLPTEEIHNCSSNFEKNFSNNISCQYFLVLNKIWTVIDYMFVCYQVLVLLLPQEEINEEYFNRSRSLFQDTSNFYETDDDYDFAELINQIDSLYLEDKPRLARLHFESTRQCALLLPSHIYGIHFADSFSQGVKFSVISNKNNLKPIFIRVKSNMKILHHLKCFGNHSVDDYEINVHCSIKEVITERKVRENCLVKAILKDKYYEECTNSCSSVSEPGVNKTLCLILKDCASDDTIKVYLPFCPKSFYGFVPGIQLQMYGFVCMCSKRGYLYLLPSSSFGIQTINSFQCRNPNMDSIDSFHPEDNLRMSPLQTAHAGTFFKCLCFIVKIISVKLSLNCKSCGRDFEEKCSCFCSYRAKLTASFIVDDGTEQMLVYCNDETARKILLFDVKELEKLSSFVTVTRSHLKFHYKVAEKETTCSTMIEDVFSVYCSSKFLCRQVYLNCKKKSSGLKNEQQSVWCYDVLQILETDLIPEFLIELEKMSLFL